MKAEDILLLFERFEQAATTINDVECWSARSLCSVLGYADWRNFVKAIDKAKESCVTAGEQELDHFVDANKMVEIGSNTTRSIDDILLTRYACYLIAQNGDPRKPQRDGMKINNTERINVLNYTQINYRINNQLV